jgi:hypothetical protein
MTLINNIVSNIKNKSLLSNLSDIEKYDNMLLNFMFFNTGVKETRIINENETISFQV